MITMSARCEAELCVNWTGQGCACAVLGIERPERHPLKPKPTCDVCKFKLADGWRVTNGGYSMRVDDSCLAEAVAEVIQGAPRVVVSRLDGE